MDHVEMVIRWPSPADADRACDTGICPGPQLTSSCVGSPRTCALRSDDTDVEHAT